MAQRHAELHRRLRRTTCGGDRRGGTDQGRPTDQRRAGQAACRARRHAVVRASGLRNEGLAGETAPRCHAPPQTPPTGQLRAEGRAVYLHCVQAHSRTPAVAALYGMRLRGASAEQALTDGRRVIPHGEPNSDFLASLERLQNPQ